MTVQDAKTYIQDTCTGLRKVSQCLRGAAENVENHTTRERMEEQMSNVESCLKECEYIANSFK